VNAGGASNPPGGAGGGAAESMTQPMPQDANTGATGAMNSEPANAGTTSNSAGTPNAAAAGAPGDSGGAAAQSDGGNPMLPEPDAEDPPPMTDPSELDQGGPVPAIDVPEGQLQLELCAPNIVRVMVSPDPAFFTRSTLATEAKHCEADTPYGLEQTDTQTTLTTALLQVVVETETGRVSFSDAEGTPILNEASRTLTPATVQGEEVLNVRQTWAANDGEALYGLGQHQLNLLDIKNYPIDLVQYNTQIVVPFFTSSRGYGVLWDNTSWTRWGDLTEFESLNNNGGAYQGTFTADQTGDYIFRTWASGDLQLRIDDELVVDHWRQGWLPGTDLVRVPMQAGESRSLALSFEPDIDVEIADLAVKPPAPNEDTSVWSEVADGIDYTFVYGPNLDNVVRGYRRLTGEAPMMPKWAFGLWMCRERYETAAEIIEVLEGFRSREIPIDNIVQDWQFWVPGTWGSQEFDTSRYPDPAGWIQQIHDEYDAQLMISVWPKFHNTTDTYAQLRDAGYIYEINAEEGIVDFGGYLMSYYDAFDPGAREMFWSQIESRLFNLGVDAWWMDGTEPEVVEGPYTSAAERRELYQTHMHPTAMGTGSRMLNAFSLVNSQAVYEGQRGAAPDQRVFILTRSGFAGQQRYAAASWSGDITTTWAAFKKQIPAGLSFTISGIPYWTMDTGGFAEYPAFSADNPEWQELNARWFQYGTFTPLLRVHGQDDRTGPREMYNFGDETYQAQLKFDRLRYRLLPYIYSLAGQVTQEGGTIMRPLVMDFRGDPETHRIRDQYMFGPAFLVNPVTDYQARERNVYLPTTTGGWYEFWSGSQVAGAQSINAAAPYDAIPLFIRAGSILPVGPEMQHTREAPTDPITLYVYAGANGTFTIYEDDGLTYQYEGGAFATIAMSYEDATKTLTIGARQGSFPGMQETRTFVVVGVTPDAPQPFDVNVTADGQSVEYDGTETSVTLP
jgi:alpha-D-xyloside xylohydrolase